MNMLQQTAPVVRQSSNTKAFYKLPVLYTRQVTRKKKTYLDGILKVTVRQGQLFCTLVDAEDPRELTLESRTLEYAESKKLLEKQDHLLTFDKYIIQVNFEEEKRTTYKSNESKTSEQLSSQSAPLLKPRKFKVPSHYVPSSCNDGGEDDHRYPSSPPGDTSNSSLSLAQKKHIDNSKYVVDDDELEDIWNANNSSSVRKNNKKRGYDDENIVNSSQEDTSVKNQAKKKDPISVSTTYRSTDEASPGHSRLKRNNSHRGVPSPTKPVKMPKTEDDLEENNNDIGLFAGFNLSSSIWNDKH
jgi:hypothetical protein